MSSSRNKRKRADEVPTATLDLETNSARSVREGLGTDTTESDQECNLKNEGDNGVSAARKCTASLAAGTSVGESNSASGTANHPQHSQPAQAAKNTTVAGNATLREEKPESEVAEHNKPRTTSQSTTKREPSRKASVAGGGAAEGRAASAFYVLGVESTASTDRQSRIKSLISHRKILLFGVRSGRSAARGRVIDMARKEAQAAKQAATIEGELSSGNTTIPTKSVPLSEKARDEAEITAFKKLSKSALQTAKKQRTENTEGGQEIRGSASLRRGGSAGKKMNTALFSLVPDRTGSSAITATELAPALPLHVATTAGEKPTLQAGALTIPVPPQWQAPTTGDRYTTHQSSAQLTGKKLKIAHASRVPDPSVGETIPKTVGSGIQKLPKSSGASAAKGTGTSSSAGAVVAGQPQHAGLNTPGFPSNRLAHHVPVVCQKAVALRQRKRAVHSKLTALLHKRNQNRAYSNNSGLDSATTDSGEAKKVFSTSVTMKNPGASYLPQRKKTHWDNLLQEMKWVATDFAQERKWKTSAARTLGFSILSTATLAMKPKTTEPSSRLNSSESPHGKDISAQPNEPPGSKYTESAATLTNELTAVRGVFYDKPTIGDTVSARRVASIMSFEVLTTCLRSGAVLQSDLVHLKALERQQNEVLVTGSDTGIESAEDSTTRKDQGMAANKEIEGSEEPASDPKSQLGSFKRINKAVDSLLESFNASPRRPPKRKVTTGGKGDGDEFSLTSKQLEIIDFVEKKWGKSKNGSGAILTGSKASGKTIAVCSLLWKHRANGAHLLVCSPFSVLKWMHELNSFQPLQIKAFGRAAGITSPLSYCKGITSCNVNDVVVCEYSDLQKLKHVDCGRFETVIIDCRYPQGFLGSRWPSLFDGKATNCTPNSTIPPELVTESWWEHLVEQVAKSSLNCIIIENPGPLTFLDHSINKTEMQRMELISLRAALVLGAQLFLSPNSSVKKRILTWARRRTKETTKSTTNVVKEVQEFFLKLMHPFSLEANNETSLELVSHKAGKRLDLEVRSCGLSSSERAEYEECCRSLRGALSFNINKAGESNLIREENHRAISDAILCLRRRCFHSQLSSLLKSMPVRSRLGSRSYPNGDTTTPSCGPSADHRMLYRKVKDSASQTDANLASSLLEGSAKLRELVSILRNECEFKIEGEDAIASFLQQPEKPRRAKHGTDQLSRKAPKKVVLLAVLPEVQVILSVLLNCIGLSHELLLRPSRYFCPSENDIRIGLPQKRALASTLAWVECQHALSRFSRSPSLQPGTPSLNLLIASPDMVAGDHGGIGIDVADFVVTVDEDWSGRNELVMRSLVAGLIPRNLRSKDKGCQLLKLVCESTCEENFLSATPEAAKSLVQAKTRSVFWPWPLDRFGRFVTSDLLPNKPDLPWPERAHHDILFAFPALNLFRFRNQALSDVLCVESLPGMLGLGTSILFLPQESARDAEAFSGQRSEEIGLLVQLMDAEDSAHSIFREAGVISSRPCLFHHTEATGQEEQILATMLYLDQFQRSKQTDSGTEQGMPTISFHRKFGASVNAASLLVDNSNIANSLQSSAGFIISPLVSASSMLLYNPLSKSVSPKLRAKESSEGSLKATRLTESTFSLLEAKAMSSPRANSYASAFVFSHDYGIRDGKQGSEPLVYVPPLFPILLSCSIQGKRDMGAIREKTPLIDAGSDSIKRPAEVTEDAVSKRLKVKNTPFSLAMVDGDIHSLLPNSGSSPPATSMTTAITEDVASRGMAANLLLDLDEDFGFVGSGEIPLSKFAVVETATSHVEVSSHALDSDWGLLQNEGSEACDAEDLYACAMSCPAGALLSGVVLFAARKKLPFSPVLGVSPVYLPSPTNTDVGRLIYEGRYAADPAAAEVGNGVFHHDMNGSHTSAKKPKKKATLPGESRSPGDLARPPRGTTHMPVNIQLEKMRDMYRNRVASFELAQQKAFGMAMFESPAYCFAALCFRNLVDQRVRRMSWVLSSPQNIGPSVATTPESSIWNYVETKTTVWTSIVKQLTTEELTSGDDSRALAEAQRSILCCSLSPPSRVDFGPFQCGYLLSLTGMTGIAPPRSRTGVSLPMGVKVPLVIEQQKCAWSDHEERTLRECAARYGMNWILASRVLSGFDDIKTNPCCPRSARNCRDRWQALARVDPSLAKEVRLSERVLRERLNLRVSAIGEQADSSIRLDVPMDDYGSAGSGTEIKLLMHTKTTDQKLNSQNSYGADSENSKMEAEDPESLEIALLSPLRLADKDVEQMEQTSNHEAMDKRSKKGFVNLLWSKAKRQVVPMTIPGVVPGSHASFVASHPTHQQSVQSSIAATWTSGRTEMWPLQFLDVAEKQRIESATSVAATLDPQASPKLSASASTRSPTGKRSPQAAASAPRTISCSPRVPAVSCSETAPLISSNRRPAPSLIAIRALAAPSTGKGGAIPNNRRPPAVAIASRAPTATTCTLRASSVSDIGRAKAVPGAARPPTGSRSHPVGANSTHSRGQQPAVAGQTYSSPAMKYPSNPQSGRHYALSTVPSPHRHAGPHSNMGSTDHPRHPQHQQRMVPSPESRTPRATAPPPQLAKYSAPTPGAHSQNIYPEATKVDPLPGPPTPARPSTNDASKPPSTLPL